MLAFYINTQSWYWILLVSSIVKLIDNFKEKFFIFLIHCHSWKYLLLEMFNHSHRNDQQICNKDTKWSCHFSLHQGNIISALNKTLWNKWWNDGCSHTSLCVVHAFIFFLHFFIWWILINLLETSSQLQQNSCNARVSEIKFVPF